MSTAATPSDSARPEPRSQTGAALVIMVGAPGSGKSYLAAQIADALGASLIQTDAVRKQLFPSPKYTPSEAAAVYGACHQRIRETLTQGGRVVFDGTNLVERRRRTLYALADDTHATLAIVATYAPEAVVRARLEQRMTARTPGDVSDADWAVYLRLRKDAQPIGRPHIIANTVVGAGPVIRLIRRIIES
jgi:predicted kinase